MSNLVLEYSQFDASKIKFAKEVVRNDRYNFSRVKCSYDTDGDSPTAFQTPPLQVRFPKKENTDSGGYSFQFCLTANDQGLVQKFGNDLDDHLVENALENSQSWFGEEKDEEILREGDLRSLMNAKGDYDPLFGTFRVADWELNHHQESKRVRIVDQQGKVVDNPDVSSLIKDNTVVKVLFSIPHITIKDTMRAGLKVHAIQVCGQGQSGTSHMEPADYESSKFDLKSDPVVMDKGGKKTYSRYQGGRLAFKLENVKVAPFAFKNVSEEGNVSYAMNVKMDNDEHRKLFETLDTDFKASLVKHSKNLFGKKQSLKLVENKFKSMLNYSKTDREAIKRGEEPQYAPTIKVNFPFYDSKFTSNVSNEDGSDFTGDLVTFVTGGNPEFKCDYSLTYDMVVSCKHVWFGGKTSVRWDCSSLVVKEGESSGPLFKFTDEVAQELDNVQDQEHSAEEVEVDSSEEEMED